MSVQTATNPETKEQVVLVDGTWLPVSQTATNPDTGARAYLANGSWVVDETAPTPAVEPEIEPERTVLGQAGEFVKAIPRGFGRTILGSLEGAAELADAATNTIGLESLIDSGEENALVSAARKGQQSLNDSFLGVDKAYEDAWITKFGEGLGSLATFATPAAVLKLANVTSKIGKAAPYALAGSSGAGEQAQRIDQRREEGMDVSSGQEDAAVLLGGLVGLSEMAPINRFLRGYDTKITDDIAAPIMKRLSEAVVSGVGEGLQETIAGLAQEGIERGIYNPDADFGQGSLDNFTIGAAAGFTADLILNSMAKGRQKSFTEAEEAKENENRRVEEERRVRVRESYAPSSLGAAEVDADGNPVVLELEPEIDLATIPPKNDSMVSYGREIAVNLGQDFPTETSFSIEQVSLPLTEAEIANQPEAVDAEGNPLGVPQASSQPAFQVYDADGRAYGSPRIGYEEAALLAGTLDREVLDQAVRNSVDSIIDKTAEEYDENVVDAVDDAGNPLGQAMSTRETLQTIGNSILNPRANQITSNAVNMAAGTTQDRGFDETLSSEAVMNKNMGRVFTEADMVSSLTASQRINRKRIAKGLPETQVFTVKEAKSVLGKNFGRLGDIGAGGLVETQQYYAGKDRSGKPVVFSSAGEIITKRYLTKRDGTDYAKPRNITTDKHAEQAAATLNRRYNKTVDETTFKNMEMGEKQIKNLLERKGINDSLNSPAINSMARAYVGKPSVSKMNRGEKKFFYQKLRKLPALSQPLTEGLPNFSEADLTRQNKTQEGIIEEEVLALPPPDINLPSAELVDEMQARLSEELKRLGIADKGVSGRIFQQYRDYGLTPDGEVVTRGGVDADKQGSYLGDFNEIAFGIQQIFADTDINMSDSSAVWENIKSILNHETVHVLRTLDLFTAEEYQVLEQAAATQKVKGSELTYLEQAVQLYPELAQGNSADRTKLMEEAVAELVRENTTLGGRPRTVINKIKRFLESVSLWIVGSPTNVRRVVEDIQNGKIGTRKAGQVRSLRATRRNAQVFESESLPAERKKEGLEKGQRLPDTSSQMSELVNKADEAEVRKEQENHWAGGAQTSFSKSKAPKNTVTAYKLFKVRREQPDKYFPLFVNTKKSVPQNEWVQAESGEINLDSGRVKSEIGELAYRPGWHAGNYASATHIGGKSKGKGPVDYRKADQIWAEVELADDLDWQEIADENGQEMLNGEIDPTTRQITDQVPIGGYYSYKTNPNMQGEWLISGDMKVNRVLTPKEVNEVGVQRDNPDLPLLPELIERDKLKWEDLAGTSKSELKQFYPDFYNRMVPNGEKKVAAKPRWFQDQEISYSRRSGISNRERDDMNKVFNDRGETRNKFDSISDGLISLNQDRTSRRQENKNKQTMSRRKFLAKMGAAGIGGAATVANITGQEDSATLGRAKPVSQELLDTPIPDEARTILQAAWSSPDRLGLNGATALKEVLSNPKYFPAELQKLASDIGSLMPKSGIILSYKPDRKGYRYTLAGSVSINVPATMTLYGEVGLDLGTFLHESLHANIVSRWRSLSVMYAGGQSQRDKIGITPEESDAYLKFQSVFREFNRASQSDFIELRDSKASWPEGLTFPKDKAKLLLALEQSRTSPDEFFARSLTDPSLQEYLSTKSYQGKTLFELFKDWISDSLFGPRTGIEASWLDAALTASDNLTASLSTRTPDFAVVKRVNEINGGPLASEQEISYSRRPITIPETSSTAPTLPIGDVELALQELLESGGDPTSQELSEIPGAPTPRRIKNKKGESVPDLIRDGSVKPTSLSRLRQMARKGLREAVGDLKWYDQFGRGLVDIVGEANIDEASVIFGITSAQNPAENNLSDTLHIMSVAREFDPVTNTSKFIEAAKVKPDGRKLFISGDSINRIVRMYNEGMAEGGLKTTTYMQLIQDRAKNVFNPFSVQDVHMSRVFGFRRKDYNDKGKLVDASVIPGDLQYRYAQYLTSYLAKEFGVTPNQMQAALWFVGKQNLSDKVTKEGEGTWNSATKYSAPEIKRIEKQIEDGVFDKSSPLTPALEKGIRPKNAPKTKQNPYTNHLQIDDLTELATQRGSKILASANPGNARGYGFPDGVSLEEITRFNKGAIEVITDEGGQIPFLRKMGIPHTVESSLGTYEGIEPNIQIRLLEGTLDQASWAGQVLGDALLQDAVVAELPIHDQGSQVGIAVRKPDGSAFTEAEVMAVAAKANPEKDPYGLNFTLVNDGKSLAFTDGRTFVREELPDYTDEMANEFLDKVEAAFDLDVQYVYNAYTQQGNYYGHEGYHSNIRGEGGVKSPAGSSDILGIANDTLYKPFWDYYLSEAERIGFPPQNLTPPTAPFLRIELAPDFPTPREIPSQDIEDAVAATLEEAESAPIGSVPAYSVNAAPESQAVARSPELGAKLSDEQEIFYSKGRPLDKDTQSVIDEVITSPAKGKKGIPFVPPEKGNAKEQFSKFRSRFINKYDPIEKLSKEMSEAQGALADSSAIAAMFFADRSQNVLAAAIKYGVPVYRDGMTTVKDFVYNGKTVKGLIGVLAPLQVSGNAQNTNLEQVFQAYAIGQRAKEINDSGKMSPVKKGDEQAFLARAELEANKYINPETGVSYVKEVYDMYQAYNNEVITFMKDTGLITDKEAASWSRSSTYYPFYKDFNGDPDAKANTIDSTGKPNNPDSILGVGTPTAPSYLPVNNQSQKLKKLEGSSEKIDVPAIDAIVQNLGAAIEMGMKNIGYQRAMRDAVYLGYAHKVDPKTKYKKNKGEDTFLGNYYVRENGKDVHYKVQDELLFNALLPISDHSAVSMITNVTSIPARFLREAVTRAPGFMFTNMVRDTMSASVTSGASFVPVIDTAKNFFGRLEEFERMGLVSGYDALNDPKDVSKFLKKEMRKLKIDTSQGLTAKAWEKSFGRVWDLLGEGTNRSDFTTRKSVYDDVLARTGNQSEAAFQAMEVLNFGRRGGNAIYRVVSASTPFLNARIQGLDVLWRAANGTYSSRSDLGKAQIQKQALLRGLALTGITALYWMLTSDDDQYKEASDYVRENNWLIPNPFGEQSFKIPIPFEVGLIFKTIPEAILNAFLKDTGASDVSATVERGVYSTLAMNPLGSFQIAAPVVEAYLNKNFFTGRPIVPYYVDEGVAKGFQETFSSSQIASWLGKEFNFSPRKIDHVMEGYAGTLGIFALDSIDQILRSPSLTGDLSKSMPAYELGTNPAFKRFFTKIEGSGYVEDFYEINEVVRKTVTTLNLLDKEGRVEEYNRYLYGRSHLLEMQDDINSISNDLSELRLDKRAIMKMDISREEKLQLITQIDSEVNDLLQIVPILRKQAKLPAGRESLYKE